MFVLNMSSHTPTDIKLYQKSRLLEIGFSTGETFTLPCEYLRTHAKSAEITTSDVPVSGKSGVNIVKIEPQGTYALRLFFDDGYDSGILSWNSLFDLGANQEANWQAYLQALEKHGLKRHTGDNPEDRTVSIRILYFIGLAKIAGRESDEIQLPKAVRDVQGLLVLLRANGEKWQKAFADDAVQVTVNKHFAELFTLLEDNDEVAIVPLNRGR